MSCKQRALVLGHLKGAGALPCLQCCLQPLQKVNLGGKRLVAFHRLFGAVDTAVNQLKVRENQFKIDGLHIAERVDIAVHMDNVVVLKAADDMHNGVGLADVGQKLVAKSLTL